MSPTVEKDAYIKFVLIQGLARMMMESTILVQLHSIADVAPSCREIHFPNYDRGGEQSDLL
jgi:hypothetical protein